jgi:hypothetical protein
MRYPPRLGHLATRQVVVSRLVLTYAQAHQLDDEEAQERLQRALAGRLYEDLLAATWDALLGGTKRLDEAGLLEKVATALKDRPFRRSKAAAVNAQWSAFLLLADLEAGTATEAARRALENDDARARLSAGLTEAGRYLAKELTK